MPRSVFGRRADWESSSRFRVVQKKKTQSPQSNPFRPGQFHRPHPRQARINAHLLKRGARIIPLAPDRDRATRLAVPSRAIGTRGRARNEGRDRRLRRERRADAPRRRPGKKTRSAPRGRGPCRAREIIRRRWSVARRSLRPGREKRPADQRPRDRPQLRPQPRRRRAPCPEIGASVFGAAAGE